MWPSFELLVSVLGALRGTLDPFVDTPTSGASRSDLPGEGLEFWVFGGLVSLK